MNETGKHLTNMWYYAAIHRLSVALLVILRIAAQCHLFRIFAAFDGTVNTAWTSVRTVIIGLPLQMLVPSKSGTAPFGGGAGNWRIIWRCRFSKMWLFFARLFLRRGSCTDNRHPIRGIVHRQSLWLAGMARHWPAGDGSCRPRASICQLSAISKWRPRLND